MSKSAYRQALERVREVSWIRAKTVAKPYTLVQVHAKVEGVSYVAAGLATCSESDTWNAELGLAIARGRAEAQIAKQVARQKNTHQDTEPLYLGFDESALKEKVREILAQRTKEQLNETLTRWMVTR